MSGLYEHKRKHIVSQIEALKKHNTGCNKNKVKQELELQQWRLQLLDKYVKLSTEELEIRREEIRKEMTEDLWAIRKTPSLGLLNEEDRRRIIEVAIIELLLGEYGGGK